MRNSTENKSEVARLRQQIALECESMNRALNGFATHGKHEIIAHKHKMLDYYQNQLEQLVGKEEACEISLNIYDQVIKPERNTKKPAAS